MERHAILHVFFTLKNIHMKTPLKKIKVDIRTLSTLIFLLIENTGLTWTESKDYSYIKK